MTASLDDVGVILAPTMRSRAYMQMMEARGLRVSQAFLIPGADRPWNGPAEIAVLLPNGATPFVLRPGEYARETVERMNLPARSLPHADINHPSTIAALERSGPRVLVYSGLPKVLLRPPVLATGIRFLHVHGGYVPHYRGATAFYFGLLTEGKLGQSAIWLDAGVDTGPLLMRRWYDVTPGLSVDQVLDPVTRADLLATVLRHFADTGHFPAAEDSAEGEKFFIIHPVLKHLALRRVTRSAASPPLRGGAQHV
ncbi:MAG: hypothetical protein FJX65_17795 [Alphaproteobacteria bacterium]|nr:hypothetical protein [Alphaproteobacteria bacterium]